MVFGINNFLGISVEGMVVRLDFYVDFWFGGINGYNYFFVIGDFGIGILGGVNISFGYG